MRMKAVRDIECSADEAFAFLSEVTNNPRWQKGQISCEWTNPGPQVVGSEYLQKARFLGRTLTNRFVVTHYDPGRSVTIHSDEGTFPITVTRSVVPTSSRSCRVTAEISGGPTGVLRWLAPVFERLAQRSVDADYDRLKGLLESTTDP